ncbi:hypothetical protein STPYR_12344 [uncultured Stenotrophomonas sp.]|uniref:Uncharacterized protein n=1 Tax=uncultured Stenotrophomonas sp. TaxID=165438 RepID=A0A1Y5QB90_9GAMM|nr:hypothetical protein STPYR_12344 [uncultured Stenotrophomonas sp.]
MAGDCPLPARRCAIPEHRTRGTSGGDVLDELWIKSGISRHWGLVHAYPHPYTRFFNGVSMQ